MRKTGFTLAELLIALSILGVIATFTIPKVLQSQQNGAWRATAKEAMATVSAAYQAYKLKNTPSASTNSQDLTPYLNYVRMDTSSTIDHVPGQVDAFCTAGAPCFVLHNGGVLQMGYLNTFGVADNNHYLYFLFDPDGTPSGSATGKGKSIIIDLYYNGRVNYSFNRTASSGTYENGSPAAWQSNPDPQPDWFSW